MVNLEWVLADRLASLKISFLWLELQWIHDGDRGFIVSQFLDLEPNYFTGTIDHLYNIVLVPTHSANTVTII